MSLSSTFQKLRSQIVTWAQDPRVALLIAIVAMLRILIGSNIVFVYAVSYAYHILNLSAFMFRRYPAKQFARDSLIARTIALGLLGVLMWPYLGSGVNPVAFVPLVAGFVLHTAAVRALGLARTYYGVELGALPPKRIRTFPYNAIPHPMEAGAMLQFAGLYLLLPAFSRDYPVLIAGHLLFSAITALVEQYDVHFKDEAFTAMTGSLREPAAKKTVDDLREWALQHYRGHLKQSCSLHEYIKTLPEEVVSRIDELRYADEITSEIQRQFPESTVVSMAMTDEVYLSRYNFDGGGDQGLFDRHYDGNLRFLPGASMVRSLIYLSSDDHLNVVFDTSGKRANMKTYDFGLLDFHKELHWVDGSYDPNHPPRVLLKCNYYVDHTGSALYRKFGILLNLAVFYSVRAAMEYSKSPKTILQKQIGIACNFFRRLNNLNPAVPVAVTLLLAAASVRLVIENWMGSY